MEAHGASSARSAHGETRPRPAGGGSGSSGSTSGESAGTVPTTEVAARSVASAWPPPLESPTTTMFSAPYIVTSER